VIKKLNLSTYTAVFFLSRKPGMTRGGDLILNPGILIINPVP